MLVTLKPLREREASADRIVARLRPKFAEISGATLFLQSVQDIRMGGRSSNAMFQYTLLSDDLDELRAYAPRIVDALRGDKTLLDVSSDQQDKGLRSDIVVDRGKAARLGLSASAIDDTLYDAFGQRQVSTIYEQLNQYHVVMEVAPKYRESKTALAELYVGADGRAARVFSPRDPVSGNGAVNAAAAPMIPLSSVSRSTDGVTPLQVNHQGHFAAITISFNLAEGKSLRDAADAIVDAMAKTGAPATIQGAFAGNAAGYRDALENQPAMIAAALTAVYIVLGILYESFLHPLTILSTLPSAGVGAFLALLGCGTELSIIAMIGVLLLIGIVKKNAIILIDFALDAERRGGLPPREAIREACRARFRPIFITTLVALFGALPLAIGAGEGAEMRRPLGVAIVGGLLVSQILTLYTTPVVFLYVDRLRPLLARLRPRARTSFSAGADARPDRQA
jgi:multidrug efflux pump